jgi:phospholipid/cholesterol/gamma-HCH transport system substrate-binding protein
LETRAGYVAVGGFVLLLVAGLVAAVLWLGKFTTGQEFSRYDVLFKGDVTGLQLDGPVRFRGIPVGRVADIRIDPETQDAVRVTIEIRRGTPVREDSQASLEFQGITGVLYVLINGGEKSAPLLPETAKPPYPVIASKAGKFEGLFQGAPDLIAHLNDLVTKVTALFSEENRTSIDTTLKNLATVTDNLSKQGGGLDRLLTEGTGTVQHISTMAQDFDALANDLRGEIKGAGGDAKAAIVDLRTMTKSLTRLSDQLNSMLVENRAPIRDFTTTGLYETTQLITDLRQLAATLSRVVQQFERDPARFLFGDRRQGFEAQ